MNNADKKMPWEELTKKGWSIVGMNHYRLHGEVHLFCSMARKGRCIVAENTDDAEVFISLAYQAENQGE